MKVLTCKERDALLRPDLEYEGWTVGATLTDLTGEFGSPRIETTWERGNQAVKDVRHPNADYKLLDVAPCEHYLFETINGTEQ